MTGRYYYSRSYKDLGNGKYETKRKYDVTEDVKAIIERQMAKYRAQLVKQGIFKNVDFRTGCGLTIAHRKMVK